CASAPRARGLNGAVSVREDRRGSQRARATWPVQIEMPTGEFIRGRVADISASGVRVTVPAAIPTGTELRLLMTLPRPPPRPALRLMVTVPGPPDRIEVVAVDGLVVRSDDDGVAVDIMSVGGPLPNRAARRGRPHLDRWEARRRSPGVAL